MREARVSRRGEGKDRVGAPGPASEAGCMRRGGFGVVLAIVGSGGTRSYRGSVIILRTRVNVNMKRRPVDIGSMACRRQVITRLLPLSVML